MAGKMLIESLGIYLPSKIVSTEEVLRGCKVRLRFPLERVTGIEFRHVAGENEFSVELARAAIVDCLSRSKYGAHEIDLVISCDTSHSTGFLRHSVEPSTALKLRDELGLANALAFDVTNACAGIFTALVIVQCMLETGAIRNALVVSGEHITHLVRTAQMEIENFRDPRLACLTLGDAGVALMLERSRNGEAGFDAITLETLGEHSSLCIGKQTDRSHGGAIMLTDSRMLSRIAIEESVKRTIGALRGNGWFPGGFQHCIMHQTAKIAVDEVIKVLNRESGQSVLHQRNTINNLKRRGNTASTTHFVALWDHARSGRIASRERVVFGIAASGVTSGTALYTLDDLPDRIRQSNSPAGATAFVSAAEANGDARGRELVRRLRRPVKIESVGLLTDSATAPRETISMLTAAAQACLRESRYGRKDIDLMINAGVYRNDFLCEPAVASIVAGRLQKDDGCNLPTDRGTLAFDLTNGALGVLQACYVAGTMIASGKFRKAMVMAAEIEINKEVCPSRRLGLEETGSALIMDGSSQHGSGFGAFLFRSFTRHKHQFASHSAVTGGRTVLSFERNAMFEASCFDCIRDSVEELMALEGLRRSDVAVVLPPLMSTGFVSRLGETLRMPQERMFHPPRDSGDMHTSSLAFAFKKLCEAKRVRAGDIGLIVGVASGIQVGCATYRF